MIQYPSAQALLAGPLGGWLRQQVHVRENAKKKQAGDRLFKAGMVLLPLAAFVFILVPVDIDLKIWGSVLAFGAAWVWTQAPKRAAVKAVKTGINQAIADALGLSYCHDCEPTPAFEQCKAYGMVPNHDRASFEDLWEGAPEGNRFMLHEAKLEERRGSGKNRHWVTVFRGAIISVGFAQQFHGTTLLARKGSHKGWFFRKKEEIKVGGEVLQIADMVDPAFTDVFDVYTTDQTEARYLVHPEYIERMTAIERAFGGENLVALFSGGELVLALKSGDMFESGSIDPAQDRAKLEETIAQFQKLADLAFALNNIDVRQRA